MQATLGLPCRPRSEFGPKLLQLLAEWTETFPRDFREESTISHLKDVVGRTSPPVTGGRARPESFQPVSTLTLGT